MPPYSGRMKENTDHKTPNTDTFYAMIRISTVYQPSAKLSTILSIITSTFTQEILTPTLKKTLTFKNGTQNY